MTLLQEFIKLSKYAGLRQDLIQAGGGNSSVKIDNQKMYIKASGYHLADMSENSGFSVIDYKLIQDFFAHSELDTEAAEKGVIEKCLIEGKKPSIETFLHALSRGTYTLHTHPIAVNVLCCRQTGQSELQKLFPDAVFVGYKKPGLALARLFFEAAKTSNTRETEIFFLKNHGLVVSANSIHAVIEKTEAVLLKIEKYLCADFSQYRNVTALMNIIEECGYDFGNIYSCNDFDVRTMAKEGMWRYDFCPDSIVFCGKLPLAIDANTKNVHGDIKNYFASYGKPAVILYKKNCYICADNFYKAKEIESILNFSTQVAAYNKNSDIVSLSDKDQNSLINWDAEKYRRTLVNK
ncbi:hypothetical protein FACS1894190_05400 [Spirochaetia bacterium]|nr:hypothetical protein FACS1894190_05400 [Spirochaetia bacterium]